MARLPQSGSDDGTWGDLLNEFLLVGHRSSGGHKFIINVKEFGAKGDGTTHDEIAIQSAINEAGDLGGGLVYYPPGTYIVGKSLLIGRVQAQGNREFLKGFSNVWLQGAGMGITTIKCTSALNGLNPQSNSPDHIGYNSVINANNVAATDVYTSSLYVKDLTVSDMTIDCTEQRPAESLSGSLGFNFCAIEFQNVRKARAMRVQVIKAYGNGIVSGSINPLMSGAVYGAWIEDCIFDECVTGILPTYGISGSVIQFGAMYAGVIKNCMFMNSGGPAIDVFNCRGTIIESNYFQGGIRKGAGDQTINSIHSDLGLTSCIIRNNVMESAGPIMLSGLMKPLYGFTSIDPAANVPNPPTSLSGIPGPNNCIIQGNIININPSHKGTRNINAIWMTTGNIPPYPTGSASNNLIQGNIIFDGPNGINVNDCSNTKIDGNQLI